MLSDLLAAENPGGIDREAFQKLLTTKPKRRIIPKGLIDSDLLEPVKTVSVGAFEAFSTRESFKIGTQDGVEIGWLGDNFKKNFVNLNKTGKNELNVPAQKLRVHKLRKNSVDTPIIAALGGEPIVETNMATMFALMKKQGLGQAGDLLVGVVGVHNNIFYIKDDNDVLWAVSCCWYLSSWNVEADAISSPSDWSEGDQVFSR